MYSVARRLASAARRAPSGLQRPQNVPALIARRIHVRRPLPYAVEDGMAPFLSPEGLQNVAVTYQQGLIDRLNDEIRGSEHRNKSVAQLVIDTALDPQYSLAFNWASEALNNDFFLHCLRPPMEGKKNNDDYLLTSPLGLVIDSQFGSLDQLKSSFSAAAMGMFSSGWVWCVCDPRGNIGILATYGAGTLLVSHREQRFEEALKFDLGGTYDPSVRAPEDMGGFVSESPVESHSADPRAPLTDAPASSPTSGVSSSVPPFMPGSPSRALHTSARASAEVPSIHDKGRAHKQVSDLNLVTKDSLGLQRHGVTDFSKLGETLFPLFAVPTNPYAWVGDGYGVWGKERFLRNYWSVLNWERAVDTFKAQCPDYIRENFKAKGVGYSHSSWMQ